MPELLMSSAEVVSEAALQLDFTSTQHCFLPLSISGVVPGPEGIS